MRVAGRCAAGLPALRSNSRSFPNRWCRGVGNFEGMTVRSVGLDIRSRALQSVHIDYTQNMLNEYEWFRVKGRMENEEVARFGAARGSKRDLPDRRRTGAGGAAEFRRYRGDRAKARATPAG